MMVAPGESVPINQWTEFIFFRVVVLHLVAFSENGPGSARAVQTFCPPLFAGRSDSIPPVLSRT